MPSFSKTFSLILLAAALLVPGAQAQTAADPALKFKYRVKTQRRFTGAAEAWVPIAAGLQRDQLEAARRQADAGRLRTFGGRHPLPQKVRLQEHVPHKGQARDQGLDQQ